MELHNLNNENDNERMQSYMTANKKDSILGSATPDNIKYECTEIINDSEKQ